MKGFHDELRSWLQESWQGLKGLTDGEIIRRLREQFELTERPDQTTIRRWIGRLRAQDVEEEEPTQGAEALPAADQRASLKEFVCDIPSMDWDIDELSRRGVPKGEADQILDVYDDLLGHQRMGLIAELEQNNKFLLLCFQVKLRQTYPSLTEGEVKRYFRMLASGWCVDVLGWEQFFLIQRRLARHPTLPKSTQSILRRMKGLISFETAS